MNKYLFLAGFCAFLSVAAGDNTQQYSTNVLSAPGGRYVFGQISMARRDQYMLDTQTGRLWQVSVGTNDNLRLFPVPYWTIKAGHEEISETPPPEMGK